MGLQELDPSKNLRPVMESQPRLKEMVREPMSLNNITWKLPLKSIEKVLKFLHEREAMKFWE